MHAQAEAVLALWFGSPRGQKRGAWFEKNPAFDEIIRAQFLPLLDQAAAGLCKDWADAPAERPHEALAFIVLTDQFPRNLFRGNARAFATDALALDAARRLVDCGADLGMLPVERQFAYLPFEHSEVLADQTRSLQLFAALRAFEPTADTWPYALRHHEIVERFGRFPHRNAALGRSTTPEEEIFLTQPGSSF